MRDTKTKDMFGGNSANDLPKKLKHMQKFGKTFHNAFSKREYRISVAKSLNQKVFHEPNQRGRFSPGTLRDLTFKIFDVQNQIAVPFIYVPDQAEFKNGLFSRILNYYDHNKSSRGPINAEVNKVAPLVIFNKTSKYYGGGKIPTLDQKRTELSRLDLEENLMFQYLNEENRLKEVVYFFDPKKERFEVHGLVDCGNKGYQFNWDVSLDEEEKLGFVAPAFNIEYETRGDLILPRLRPLNDFEIRKNSHIMWK